MNKQNVDFKAGRMVYFDHETSWQALEYFIYVDVPLTGTRLMFLLALKKFKLVTVI